MQAIGTSGSDLFRTCKLVDATVTNRIASIKHIACQAAQACTDMRV